MSTKGVMESNRFHTKPRRKNSTEVDVLEAARYFSGAPEPHIYIDAAHSQRHMKGESTVWGGRKSLDISLKTSIFSSQSYKVNEKHVKEKKSKLPSSPGGKLASFLNSLFSQASSKKKSKSSSQSVKGEEESPGGRRRKRRSSISYFPGFGNSRSRSFYSSSHSGFRTPPAILSQTPTKAYKDITGYPGEKQVVSLSNYNEQARSMSSFSQNEISINDQREYKLGWDREHRYTGEFPDRDRIGHNEAYLEKERTVYNKVLPKKGITEEDRTWVDEVSSQKSFRRAEEVDDDEDSDSSSDLFDLPNYVLGVYSNGLPVYETTHVENINRRTT